jgi:glycosyltransferase involved in cell wall biosynthesis
LPASQAASNADGAPAAAAKNCIRLLTFTTLYPNRAQPFHGLFVERRLARLLATGEVTSEVVAPVPWFPFKDARFGRYATFARVPKREQRGGLQVSHPRFPVIPKIGMSAAPALMARAVAGPVARVFRERGCEVLDAHYFYPDGVAAARLHAALRCPLVITARGSDINLIAEDPGPRRQILWAANECAAIITVSDALKRRLVEMGVGEEKVTVLRNGVDLGVFRPLPEAIVTNGTGPVLVTVGNLVGGKGQDIAIRALTKLPGATLLVIGDGPRRAELERLAAEAGVLARTKFLGQMNEEGLVRHYNAADATLLASAREGLPNVVLESLACGTPVIASRVGGVPEIITSPEAGIIMPTTSADGLVSAVNELLSQPKRRAAVRSFAERFGWEQTIRDQVALYRRVLAGTGGSRLAARAR